MKHYPASCTQYLFYLIYLPLQLSSLRFKLRDLYSIMKHFHLIRRFLSSPTSVDLVHSLMPIDFLSQENNPSNVFTHYPVLKLNEPPFIHDGLREN
jgi:hypothetical protein